MKANQFSDVLLLSQFNKQIIDAGNDGLFYKIDTSLRRCYISVHHLEYNANCKLSIPFQFHYQHFIVDCEILFNWCRDAIVNYELSEIILTGFRQNGVHALLLAEQMRKRNLQPTFNCVTYGVKYSTALLVNHDLFSYVHVTIPKDDYVHCPFYFCNSLMVDAYLGKKSLEYFFTRISGIFFDKAPELDIANYVSYIEFYNLMHYNLSNEKSHCVDGKVVCEDGMNSTAVILEVSVDTNKQELTTNDISQIDPMHTNDQNTQCPWDIILVNEDNDHCGYTEPTAHA